MCKVMEDMRNEIRNKTLRESAINTAMRMIANGILTMEKLLNMQGSLLMK